MTLLELFQLLRKHWKLMVALPIAAAAIMALVSVLILPNVYTAETSIYALSNTNSQAKGDDSGVTYQDMQMSQLLANDFAELAKNRKVRANVAKDLGLENLSGYKINVVAATTTRLIKVQVTGEDPEMSAKIANALAHEISATASEVMGIEAVNVVNEAETPQSKSGPPRKRYTLMALLAGLLAAAGIVILRDMLDTTIKDDEVEQLIGVPVIGRFPYEKGGKA